MTLTTISPMLAAGLAILAAYLIGSIPFGYLIARVAKGIDIRTVGSGNVGATNVGRVLGWRYGWTVLALDMAKGYLPTLLLPLLVSAMNGHTLADLPVLAGLAAILGHTFPIYLKFRGGKGVATSLGVVLALDPICSASAVLVFGVVLVSTRYMSMASLSGGLTFALAYFFRTHAPFSREHIAMSVFSIAVVALMVVRHRSNIARIRQGTENRVNLGRSKKRQEESSGSPGHGDAPGPRGRIAVFVMLALSLVSLAALTGSWLVRNASRTVEAEAGPWALKETDRLVTGQQRIDRVAFAPGGDRLAGVCPRYNTLVIYDVNRAGTLAQVSETQLDGRPVGVVSLGSRFLVLERPPGDNKHLEPGWWEAFDRDGHRVGSRQRTGFYPDDLAATADGRRLFILCSGRSEGDANKPLGSLQAFDIDPESLTTHALGHVTFDPSDDPERLSVSASSRYAAVLLAKSRRTVAVDFHDPEMPVLIGRTPPSLAGAPYVSPSPDNDDWIMMPAGSDSDTVALESPGSSTNDAPTPEKHPDYVVTARDTESALEIYRTEPTREVGKFPLLGPFNLGRTRPTGLAYSPERNLIAVSTRTGSIHVVELRTR